MIAFQPHRYSRTRDCIAEFAHAFDCAHVLFTTEIYPAGESPIPGVSGIALAETIKSAGHPSVTFIERKEALPDQVLPHLRPGDILLTLGAGDIWKAGTGILARLESA